jgi:hypothetical protein
MNEKLIIIQTREEMKQLCNELMMCPRVAVDVESNGLNAYGSNVIIGMSLWLPTTTAATISPYVTVKAGLR